MSDSDLHQMKLNGLAKDEADCNRLNIQHRFMHISALSPSTRTSHAARSGELFTAEEIRDWLGQDGNSVGCKCSFSVVLVDELGNPRSLGLVQKVVAAREVFLARRNNAC